jgi:hypothetical protein
LGGPDQRGWGRRSGRRRWLAGGLSHGGASPEMIDLGCHAPHGSAPARPQEPTEGLGTGHKAQEGAVGGKGLLLTTVRGGRRSWEEALGCAAGLRVPRSAAHTGGEGRVGIEGPEDVPARANCGGVGDGQRRRLLQSERRGGGAGARGALESCGGVGWPQGRPRIRKEGWQPRCAGRPATDAAHPAGGCGSPPSERGRASRRV